MMPTADTILTAFRTGSSLPVLVVTTGRAKSVVKWNGTGEGIAANVCDWIALHCAKHIGIPVPKPHLIAVTSDLVRDDADPEINELIIRSIGINLGIEYFEHTLPFTSNAPIDSALKQLIYCYDVLLLNMDRTAANPNMFFANEMLYCLDFAATMALKIFFERSEFSKNTILPLLRQHPFYAPEREVTIPEIIMGKHTIRKIIRSIPDEWMSYGSASREQLTGDIESLFLNARTTIRHRLHLIDEILLETHEERRARTDANRVAFEQFVKKYQ